ncbi:fibronectin type III domain protein [Francisella philomiragia subsp. philomiragia ATCC 25015]|nr:fibronectin type III domain protein [Francisella philomiragia subsp. philomiragia ATCC 25015]
MKLRSKVLSGMGFVGLLLPMWSQAAIVWTTAPACSAQSKSVTCEWAAANDAGDPVSSYDVVVYQDYSPMPNRAFIGAKFTTGILDQDSLQLGSSYDVQVTAHDGQEASTAISDAVTYTNSAVTGVKAVQWTNAPVFEVEGTRLIAAWNAEIVDGAGETLYYDIYLTKPGTFEGVYSSLDQTNPGMILDLTTLPGFESGRYMVQVVAHGADNTVERTIEQSIAQDIVMPVTVSHTFVYDSQYPLPTGQTMTDVANALNVYNETAHGTFGVDNYDNLTITCDDSWSWPSGFEPAWGTATNNPAQYGNDQAYIFWYDNSWLGFDNANIWTSVNDVQNMNEFSIGCFPV